MSSSPITLPNNWQPRDYQMPLWRYLHGGGKRAVAVWHRRSGKDSTALNWTACAAHERVGVYWHMLPEATQGRKVVWDAVDRDGRKVIDQVFPPEIRAGKNSVDMRISLLNGSVWQVVGSDNYDSLVGSNPVGVVFSEYSIAKPEAWNFIRPILLENNGWALFIYTPRGQNHGYDLLRMAERNRNWMAQTLTWRDTGVLTQEDIDRERMELTEQGEDAEAVIAQEYECSFSAAVRGSYYGGHITDLEGSGRIADVPHDPAHPVETWWDIGVGDDTAVWFVQQVGETVRVIDYLEDRGKGLDHYAREIKAKPYNYREHLWPHDGDNREWGSDGKRRRDIGEQLGLKPIRIVPSHAVDQGINRVRMILPKCVFDATRCRVGLKHLKHYSRQWNETKHAFSNTPRHDEHSHCADAFRIGCMGMEPPSRGKVDLSAFEKRTWM